MIATDPTIPTRWTTCTCTDGLHDDPLAWQRSHADREFAEIIARHTNRHVVPVADLQAVAA